MFTQSGRSENSLFNGKSVYPTSSTAACLPNLSFLNRWMDSLVLCFWHRLDQQRERLAEACGAGRFASIVPETHHDEIVRIRGLADVAQPQNAGRTSALPYEATCSHRAGRA